MKKENLGTPQAAAAAAVVEFAERWDRQLATLARNVQCQCERPQACIQELDHEPGCAVGRFGQVGRLMREEAAEARVRACDSEL